MASVDGLEVAASVDGDDFMLSVPGASGALVRTGQGSDVTRVASRAVVSGHLALLSFGFPMVGTAHAEGEHLIVCHMLRTPPGARWDGTDLDVGQSFIYPPGSSQVAIDPEGLTFAMAVVPWDDVERAAALLGYDIEPATRPHVRRANSLSPMRSLFHGVPDEAEPPVPIGEDAVVFDSLLDAVVRESCAPMSSTASARRARWDSRDLVEEAIDWLADAGLWQTSTLTLCRQVGVSERRLQMAFRETYDTTPGRFMRHRALQAAHRALRAAEPGSVEVAHVAAAHGFRHAGRFAALHADVFGSSPSHVLHAV